MHFHLKRSLTAGNKGGKVGVVRHPTDPSNRHTSDLMQRILATSEQNHILRKFGGKGSTSVHGTEGALPVFPPVSASVTMNVALSNAMTL
jgi:hypothetical protein